MLWNIKVASLKRLQGDAYGSSQGSTFVFRGPWALVDTVNLGTTADVYVVEIDKTRYALKKCRHPHAARQLRVEYELIQHLRASPMADYVPVTHGWIPELHGFLMDCLRYPTSDELETTEWITQVATSLRTLHQVALPAIDDLPDDRATQDVADALGQRLLELYSLSQRGTSYWSGLSESDMPLLHSIREHYPVYAKLVSELHSYLGGCPAAIAHGDLAGDNLMVDSCGGLVLTDRGSARISIPLSDVASVWVYAGWSDSEKDLFWDAYTLNGADRGMMTRSAAELMTRALRYGVCIQSLLMVISGDLDSIGRQFLEKAIAAL